MNILSEVLGAAEHISTTTFFLRTLVVGILLYLEGRFLPHRSGGQFAGYDFTFFWMMGGITAGPLFEPKISVVNTVAIIVVLYLLHYLISYAIVKNRAFAKLLVGEAVPLISAGKVLRHNLKKNLLPLELLLSELRTVDAPNLNEIEAAAFETNGHISVLKKADHSPVTVQDLNIATSGGGFPVLLINDGKVVTTNLYKTGHDEKWLHNQLQQKGIDNANAVYVAMIDSTGTLYCSCKDNSNIQSG
ncbi:YetF domain-containing protein [Sporomusa acidovorans]|uniref:YetF domain-containing protein n=1 Tax=Sporomusa acidovorans TaxID=112900 RepID=UPI00088B7B50|nr:YetF domain-containing protein [Sporomusa acidovorans]OZC18991.1 hypothetical protein SPACI_30770 [Sporomusa acidovorans DSM 3132]SDD72300.1 Uncharacterized membrane protein YcaP, DUF421 family [Sporomusa acidovorans]